MEELIAVLFLSREIAHREHLKTESYATHVALGSFYEDIIPLADSIAEYVQGKYGKKLGDIPYFSNASKGDVKVALKKYLGQVEDLRDDCYPDDTALQNMIDEVVSLYASTLYKLTFLK